MAGYGPPDEEPFIHYNAATPDSQMYADLEQPQQPLNQQPLGQAYSEVPLYADLGGPPPSHQNAAPAAAASASTSSCAGDSAAPLVPPAAASRAQQQQQQQGDMRLAFSTSATNGVAPKPAKQPRAEGALSPMHAALWLSHDADTAYSPKANSRLRMR